MGELQRRLYAVYRGCGGSTPLHYDVPCLAQASSPPHPPSVLDPGPRNLLGIVGWLFRLSHLLGNYYVQLAIFIVFVCLAVFRRKDRGAWIYAFLSGWAFPELVIFHWLR